MSGSYGQSKQDLLESFREVSRLIWEKSVPGENPPSFQDNLKKFETRVFLLTMSFGLLWAGSCSLAGRYGGPFVWLAISTGGMFLSHGLTLYWFRRLLAKEKSEEADAANQAMDPVGFDTADNGKAVKAKIPHGLLDRIMTKLHTAAYLKYATKEPGVRMEDISVEWTEWDVPGADPKMKGVVQVPPGAIRMNKEQAFVRANLPINIILQFRETRAAVGWNSVYPKLVNGSFKFLDAIVENILAKTDEQIRKGNKYLPF